MAGIECALHELHARLAVQGGVDLEALAGTLPTVGAARRTLRVQECRLRIMLGAEDFLESIVNRRVVVDDQHTPIGESGTIDHGYFSGVAAGGSEGTVATGVLLPTQNAWCINRLRECQGLAVLTAMPCHDSR